MAYQPDQFDAIPADYSGGDGDDRYVLQKHDFSETVSMGGGDDVVVSKNGGLTAGDRIDGGAGYDTLVIQGPISDKVDFGANTLTNFEEIDLAGRGQYNLELNKAMVSAGDTFTVKVTSAEVTGIKVDASAIAAGHVVLIGSGGDDTLIGGSLGDQLNGGAGNDLLIGGSSHDRFVFTDTSKGEANWGHDLIKDFTIGSDKVVLQTSSATSFSDLTITDSKDGAVVSTDGHNEIFFYGLKASQLHASDFIFQSAPQSASASHLAPLHAEVDLHHVAPIA